MVAPQTRFLPCLAAIALAACGGSGSSSGGTIDGASPAGIWRGTDPANGLAVVALIDAAGEAEFLRTDNALLSGEVSTAQDNSVSGAGQAYDTNKFPDGTTAGSWTLQGTLTERQSLSVTVSVVTAAGSVITQTLDLTFDPAYDQPSSLASLTGAYAPVPNGTPYLFGPNGTFSLSDLICEANGQFSIIDPGHNIYRVSATGECDHGGSTTSNGLATLDTSVSPAQLLVGWAGEGSGDAEFWVSRNP